MRPSYSSNFSKLYLLTNKPVELSMDNIKMKIIFPNMYDILSGNQYITFLSLFTDTSLWSGNGSFVANDYYELILGMNTYFKFLDLNEIFKKLLPDISISNRSIKCGDIDLTHDQVELIIDMLLVSSNFMTWDDFEKKGKEQEQSEAIRAWNRKLKEREERIKKTKQKSNSQSNIKMEEVFISILNSFPQYKIEDLMELNYFAIMFFFEWSQKIAIQKVNDIAAGNGLLKKYKPLIN